MLTGAFSGAWMMTVHLMSKAWYCKRQHTPSADVLTLATPGSALASMDSNHGHRVSIDSNANHLRQTDTLGSRYDVNLPLFLCLVGK